MKKLFPIILIVLILLVFGINKYLKSEKFAKSKKGSGKVEDIHDILTSSDINYLANNDRVEWYRQVLRADPRAFKIMERKAEENETTVEQELKKEAERIVNIENEKKQKSKSNQ